MSNYEPSQQLIMECSMPADYSFKKLNNLEASLGPEGARKCRVGKVPEKGANNHRYLTKSIWLNNNKLTNIAHIDTFVNNLIEEPKELGWLDFSFNYITTIDEALHSFPNLKIIYFHGNLIDDLDEVFKLRPLKNLRSVTFHGNPIADHPRYRKYVVAVLPQIVNLDFSPVLKDEKYFPPPPEAVRMLKKEAEEKEGTEKEK